MIPVAIDEHVGTVLGAPIRDARTGRLAGNPTMLWNTYNPRAYPGDRDNAPIVDVPARSENI